MPSSLSALEKLAWLRLIRTENVGNITFAALLRQFGSASAALEAIPTLAARGGRAKPLKVPSKASAEKELETCISAGVAVIASIEAAYPPLLRHIDDAPPLLFALGNAETLQQRSVALVGSRNASGNGQRFAKTIAIDLGKKGFAVISGLARGIDTAAHEGSLSTGTIAVVAGGVDHIYPPENKVLYEKIIKNGCIVAENPLGSVPQARHFPRRNRIISGIAEALVVVEATLKSGSLITARLAAEQGREVFAVPGSPLDPRCTGTNKLLKEGATLLESAADVLAVLQHPPSLLKESLAPPPTGHIPQFEAAELNAAREAIINLLTTTPFAIDLLIRMANLPPALCHAVLLELELAGRVERVTGNTVVRVY
jgi:DNA processing protein